MMWMYLHVDDGVQLRAGKNLHFRRYQSGDGTKFHPVSKSILLNKFQQIIIFDFAV